MTKLTVIRGTGELDDTDSAPGEHVEPDYSIFDRSIRYDPYLIDETTYTRDEILRARALHPSSAPARPHLVLRTA